MCCTAMALGSWQKRRTGRFVLSVFSLLLTLEVATAQPNQTFNAESSIQHLQQLLVTTASQAAGWYYKSLEAAIYAVAASQDVPQGLSVDRGFIVPIAGGSNLLAVYSANASAVVLAFGGSNETLANVTANNPLETDAFYKGAFSNQGNGSVDPLLADPFQGRIGGGYQGLYRVVRNVSNGATPARIVATGYAEGGALAKLAAVWAGAAFAEAQIRSINFGAPRVGSNRFAWAYQQLVDVRYEWATRSDQRVNQPADSPVSDALFFLDGNVPVNASTGPQDSLQYYLAILEHNTVGSTNQKNLGGDSAIGSISPGNSTDPGTSITPSPTSPPPSGFLGELKSRAQSIINGISQTLSAAKGELYRVSNQDAQQNITWVNYTALEPDACPPILCKMRALTTAACQAYKNGNNTIASGSTTIADQKEGTRVAVAWLPDNSTAWFSWRGSVSKKDWLADFQLWMNNDPLSPILNQLYPGARVHHGFLDQFQAVTDQAANASQNIRSVVDGMSGGTPPTRVFCSGHSLGAGLATLCGVWASLQWPAADVRVVTMGSPAVGNLEFARAFKLAVGREYRLIDRLDVVPALPPFNGYFQLDFPLWIQDNGTIVAENRPWMSTKDLTWDDHACHTYEHATYNVTHVSAPESITGLAPI